MSLLLVRSTKTLLILVSVKNICLSSWFSMSWIIELLVDYGHNMIIKRFIVIILFCKGMSVLSTDVFYINRINLGW